MPLLTVPLVSGKWSFLCTVVCTYNMKAAAAGSWPRCLTQKDASPGQSIGMRSCKVIFLSLAAMFGVGHNARQLLPKFVSGHGQS